MNQFFKLLLIVAGVLAIDDDCFLNLNIPSQQNTVITNEKLLNCTEASMFWNYPTNNLTIVFTSLHSDQFKFCLLKSNQIYSDIPVYRIQRDQEVLVTKSENKICMNSDESEKSLLTLKLVGPKQMHYYGLLIDYSIE